MTLRRFLWPRSANSGEASGGSTRGSGRAEAGTVDLSRWSEADRVEVRTNMAVRVSILSDADTVAELAARAAALGNRDWTVPAKGVPVAKLRVEFYKGDKILGSLGVGRGFFSVHQAGSFWSRPSTPQQRAEFLALAGVQDPDASS